jgi:hypothetical protein
MSRSIHRCLLGTIALLVAALVVSAAAGPARSTSGSTTFSGRATVLQGSVAGVTIPCLASVNNLTLVPQPPTDNCRGVGDTGAVALGGGHLEASLLCYPASNDPACVVSVPDLTSGTVRAQALHASVVAHGNSSDADVSVANFGANAAGQTVTASFLTARARATCQNGSVSVSADSQIADLVISGVNNGQPIVVDGTPNQTITLPSLTGGSVIINEQSPISDANGDQGISVNALHVMIPATIVAGVTVPATDLIVGHAEADIACAALPQCPGQHQFVTSGGFINDATGAKLHFTVAGRDTTTGADPWGHVLYKPAGLHVKNPYALVFYRQFNTLYGDLPNHQELQAVQSKLGTLYANRASFQGAAILYWTANGQAASATNSIVGEVLVIDMGEPGNQPKGFDYFEIAYVANAAGGFLQGGNIQMHGKC